jgi:hypothetical protein
VIYISNVILFMSAYQGDIFILNHLVLEHLSGVKGGFPLEEAYYLILSLFQGVEYFSRGFCMLY